MLTQKAAALLASIYQPGPDLAPGTPASLDLYSKILTQIASALEDSFYEEGPNHLQQNILDLLRATAKEIPGFYELGAF